MGLGLDRRTAFIGGGRQAPQQNTGAQKFLIRPKSIELGRSIDRWGGGAPHKSEARARSRSLVVPVPPTGTTQRPIRARASSSRASHHHQPRATTRCQRCPLIDRLIGRRMYQAQHAFIHNRQRGHPFSIISTPLALSPPDPEQAR